MKKKAEDRKQERRQTTQRKEQENRNRMSAPRRQQEQRQSRGSEIPQRQVARKAQKVSHRRAARHSRQATHRTLAFRHRHPYHFGLAVAFIIALGLSFFMPVGSSRLNALKDLRDDYRGALTKTLIANYDFSQPRADNPLVPSGWYFGTQTTNGFPFSQNADLDAWDTTNLYKTGDGLFVSDIQRSSYIFTPTFELQKVKSDKMQTRITFSYTMPPETAFGCCMEILVAYTADGVTQTGTVISIDGSNPDAVSCNDLNTQVWNSCDIRSTTFGDKTTVTANFYPQSGDIAQMGLLFNPGATGASGTTINQLRLDVTNPPGQIKIRIQEIVSNVIEKIRDRRNP